MGFLRAQCTVVIRRLLLHVAFVLAFVNNGIWWVARCFGLEENFDLQTSAWQERSRKSCASVSAETIRRNLPVATFGEFMQRRWEIEEDFVCSICLSGFEVNGEIRELGNCFHIFHRNCLDKWLEQCQNTCPLCRTALLPQVACEEVNSGESSWFVDEICYLFAEDLVHNPQ